jgi:hypothetical protein
VPDAAAVPLENSGPLAALIGSAARGAGMLNSLSLGSCVPKSDSAQELFPLDLPGRQSPHFNKPKHRNLRWREANPPSKVGAPNRLRPFSGGRRCADGERSGVPGSLRSIPARNQAAQWPWRKALLSDFPADGALVRTVPTNWESLTSQTFSSIQYIL